MAEIKLTIPDNKIQIIKDSFSDVYKIPLDEETKEPLFTDNQWVKEKIIQFIRLIVQGKINKDAENAVEEFEL